MAKAATYMKDIRAQVKENHGGKVPAYLNSTIRLYADALELKDHYKEIVMREGAVIYEQGSMGNTIRKQHPLCNLIYQQESICQKYAKDLGLTAAKAAVRVEATDVDEEDPMLKYYKK
jgi:hypothetical protein